MATRRFPEGFVWGTATSAHQVEGGNWNNDWWMWEHDPASPCQEPSGDACDHWHRWPEDVRLLAELGFNGYRFSLEWSRIEPEDGEFSRAALDHYRRVCAACREQGVEPIVTFHHFTTPRWLAARGGWANPETADRFARFAARAAAHLGDVMGRACTLNEPNIVATFGYLHGLFPPGKRDPDLRRRVNEVLIDAHRKATAAIRSGPGRPAVGLVLAMSDCQAVPGGDAERIEFVGRALGGVLACLADGIDVRGYVYWSLLDNFEWVLGYRPTFGLVAVDRATQARRPKPSARWLGAIAQANALPA